MENIEYYVYDWKQVYGGTLINESKGVYYCSPLTFDLQGLINNLEKTIVKNPESEIIIENIKEITEEDFAKIPGVPESFVVKTLQNKG